MAVLRRLTLAIAAIYISIMSAGAHPASPEIFGALPNTDEMEISPDGKTIAALKNAEGQTYIIFIDLERPNEQPKGIRIEESDARTLIWANNNYLLVLLSESKRVNASSGKTIIEFFRWHSINRHTMKWTKIFSNEAGYFLGRSGRFLGPAQDKTDKAIFLRDVPGKPFPIYEVDLDSGGKRIIHRGKDDTIDWVTDKHGEPIARIDYDSHKEQRELYLKQPGSNSFDLANTFPEEKDAKFPAISFFGPLADRRYIAAAVWDENKNVRLVRYDTQTNKIAGQLTRWPMRGTLEVITDPHTATTTAVTFVDDLPRIVHLDPALQSLQSALAEALPRAAPRIVSKATDSSRMIVEAIYTDHPRRFYLYDRATNSLALMGTAYEKLDGSVFARKEKYDYRTDDGLKIPGYLTRPLNRASGGAPLIVLPHGGPEARSDQAFDWWAFFYAANGYHVYEPNFRGSGGYGYPFRAAGFGEWGRKMQDDITDGVKKLISDGLVDPRRICIVGGSYGGYAALAGATLTPDLYACAVSVNGVSDLSAMLGEEAGYSEWYEEYWEERVGGTRFKSKTIDEVSPAEIAERTGPPVMLIHSIDDIVVSIEQSERMYRALKSEDKPVEFIKLKGEDHWLSNGRTRKQMLEASIDFIDRHIGD